MIPPNSVPGLSSGTEPFRNLQLSSDFTNHILTPDPIILRSPQASPRAEFESIPTDNPMKTTRIHLILALVASVVASAQQRPPQGDRRPPPGPPPGQPPVPALFMALDTNHDGFLSTEEVQAAADVIAKLDRNHDKKISLDEFRMPPPDGKKSRKDPNKPNGPPRGKPPLPPIIEALDTDHDGTISAEEMKNAPESLKTLDKDGNGELSPEELRPLGPPPPPEGGGDGDGPQGPPPTGEKPYGE